MLWSACLGADNGVLTWLKVPLNLLFFFLILLFGISSIFVLNEFVVMEYFTHWIDFGHDIDIIDWLVSTLMKK